MNIIIANELCQMLRPDPFTLYTKKLGKKKVQNNSKYVIFFN